MISENDKSYEYFAICPPGLEAIVQEEILHKYNDIPSLSLFEITAINGGVSFKSSTLEANKLNLILKTPTRILRRITNFKCRDFPKLFTKFSKINWNSHIQSSEINLKVSSTKSRLIHTSKIEKTCRDAFIKYRKGSPVKEKYSLIANQGSTQTIYVKFHEDNVTISIDTTGDRLNIRNERTYISHAPLRENIASALVYALAQNKKNVKMLIEPMAGSAVFTIESINFNSLNNRQFSYQYCFPFDMTTLKNEQHKEKLYESYIINENDQNIILSIENNLKNINAYINDSITITNRDYLNLKIENPTDLIVNLPYGKRIKVGDLESFYREFINWCQSQNELSQIGILLPKNWESLFKKSFKNYVLEKEYFFKNGGIEVVFMVLKKKDQGQSKPEF